MAAHRTRRRADLRVPGRNQGTRCVHTNVHITGTRLPTRSPVSLEHLQYETCKHLVTLHFDKREGPTAGTHALPALEFLARLPVHVPDKRERLVREYGAYSVRRRARWRNAGILADTRPLAATSPTADGATPDWPALRAMKQRWAQLLKRIFEVDPLACPRGGAAMRIVSFILDEDVITAILRHVRRKGRDPRALPEHAAAGRSPP
jgi:hypothetical protein